MIKKITNKQVTHIKYIKDALSHAHSHIIYYVTIQFKLIKFIWMYEIIFNIIKSEPTCNELITLSSWLSFMRFKCNLGVSFANSPQMQLFILYFFLYTTKKLDLQVATLSEVTFFLL